MRSIYLRTTKKEVFMDRLLEVGDIIKITEGMWVFAKLPKGIGSKPLTDIKVGSKWTDSLYSTFRRVFDTSIFIGEYEVISTETRKASIPDAPDGYYVTCRKKGVESDEADISFYQTDRWMALVKPENLELIS
jgi:hypothetical protein